MGTEPVDNNPNDPIGLQIKQEMLENDQENFAVTFWGTEDDIDARLEKAKANEANTKKIAEEKAKLILFSPKAIGTRSDRNSSTASNESQVASSSNTSYTHEEEDMETNTDEKAENKKQKNPRKEKTSRKKSGDGNKSKTK